MRKISCKSSCSFVSDVSYAPIASGPAIEVEKPNIVPTLDFGVMRENLAEIKKKEARAWALLEEKKKKGSAAKSFDDW